MNSNYKLKSIYIYPVKSLGEISLNSVLAYATGLALDRNWMLVDSKGKFITKRKHPGLSLYKIKLLDDHLLVEHEGRHLEIQFSKASNNLLEVEIWNHKNLIAAEYSTEASQWFSTHLKTDCKLVKLLPETNRIKTYGEDKSTSVSFADGYPILIIGTASIKLLEDKLGFKIDPLRFRPNLIVETEVPHIEDSWTQLDYNGLTLEIANACKRCVVPTMHPTTGVKNPEINKVLAQYRRSDGHILFGVNAVVKSQGSLDIACQLNIK